MKLSEIEIEEIEIILKDYNSASIKVLNRAKEVLSLICNCYCVKYEWSAFYNAADNSFNGGLLEQCWKDNYIVMTGEWTGRPTLRASFYENFSQFPKKFLYMSNTDIVKETMSNIQKEQKRLVDLAQSELETIESTKIIKAVALGKLTTEEKIALGIVI